MFLLHDNAAPARAGWSYTGTGTENNLLLSGASTTFEVPNFGGGAIDKSAWIAIYLSPYVENGITRNDWAQWGVGKHETFGLGTVFEFYHLGGGGAFTPPMRLVTSGVPLNVRERVKWSIDNIPGTTLWNFSRNGIVIWEVDLKVSTCKKIELMTEAYAKRPPNMPTMRFDPAIEMKDINGVWSGLADAYVQQSNWNIQGEGENKLMMGGSGSSVPIDTKLW